MNLKIQCPKCGGFAINTRTSSRYTSTTWEMWAFCRTCNSKMKVVASISDFFEPNYAKVEPSKWDSLQFSELELTD